MTKDKITKITDRIFKDNRHQIDILIMAINHARSKSTSSVYRMMLHATNKLVGEFDLSEIPEILNLQSDYEIECLFDAIVDDIESLIDDYGGKELWVYFSFEDWVTLWERVRGHYFKKLRERWNQEKELM